MEAQERNGCELSIVMPCLNESETLSICIRKARQFLSDHDVAGEIIVADNGSTDGSGTIATQMGARVVHIAESGYGSAIMGGVRAAYGEYVIMGDADDSYDFTNLQPFLDRLREGYDLVMGNRFAGGIQPNAMPNLHRYVGNPALTSLGRIMFQSPCRDFHCGLRGFRKSAIMRLDLQTTGMEFASEMVVKAALYQFKTAEVPTILYPDGRSRRPHLRTWHDGWRHLRFLLLYSPRWLFFYPGILLMLMGSLIMFWLIPGPRSIGNATFDIHTLLYAGLAIIIGFQAVVFAAFSRVFAVTEGFLPAQPRLKWLLSILKLERCLLVGLTLIMAGLLGSLYVVSDWGMRSFGPLHPTETMRVVIPSGLALTLGCQTVFSSFFLSLLGLPRRGVQQ